MHSLKNIVANGLKVEKKVGSESFIDEEEQQVGQIQLKMQLLKIFCVKRDTFTNQILLHLFL